MGMIASTPQHEPLALAPARRWNPAHLLAASVILYVALNMGDLITTYVGLHIGLREGNPLMGHLLDIYGFSALIVYKLLVVTVVSVGVTALRQPYPRLARITLLICNALVGTAVLLNLLQFIVR